MTTVPVGSYAVYAISKDDVDGEVLTQGHVPYVTTAASVEAAVDYAIDGIGLAPGPHSLAIFRGEDASLQFLTVQVPEPQPKVEISTVGTVSLTPKRGLFARS